MRKLLALIIVFTMTINICIGSVYAASSSSNVLTTNVVVDGVTYTIDKKQELNGEVTVVVTSIDSKATAVYNKSKNTVHIISDRIPTTKVGYVNALSTLPLHQDYVIDMNAQMQAYNDLQLAASTTVIYDLKDSRHGVKAYVTSPKSDFFTWNIAYDPTHYKTLNQTASNKVNLVSFKEKLSALKSKEAEVNSCIGGAAAAGFMMGATVETLVAAVISGCTAVGCLYQTAVKAGEEQVLWQDCKYYYLNAQ